MANLALSMMEFRDAYIAADQWDVALRLVKWGMDWLVKAHIKASDTPAENAFVGQVRWCPSHLCTCINVVCLGGALGWVP